jgi:hypothetical protein
VPEFGERWRIHRDYWNGAEAGLCNDVAEFSRFASDLIIEGRIEDLREIFALIEELIVNGDEDVKDAIATCFVENLANWFVNNPSHEQFIKLLGPASRAYWKAWDDFTGVQTDGLHEDRDIQ